MNRNDVVKYLTQQREQIDIALGALNNIDKLEAAKGGILPVANVTQFRRSAGNRKSHKKQTPAAVANTA